MEKQIQQTLTEKEQESFMRYMSVYETDKEILNAFNQIYLEGLGFGLDPTYSKGNIYGDGEKPRLKFDLEPETEDTKQADCKKLPLENNSQISIVFDPPFLFRDRKAVNNDKMCGRFAYFQTFEDLIKMYKDSLKEFYRILQNYGILIFKCQDMTDGSGSRPFFDTHCEVIKMAREQGFSLRDIGILVKKNKIIRKAKVQGCLRKVHSYYLVFRKEKNKEVKQEAMQSEARHSSQA